MKSYIAQNCNNVLVLGWHNGEAHINIENDTSNSYHVAEVRTGQPNQPGVVYNS